MLRGLQQQVFERLMQTLIDISREDLAMTNQSKVRNRLLEYMDPADFALLSPFLDPVELDRDYVLVIPNRPIEYVYFIESGMVSVVAEKADGRSIEVGIYGRDGMGASTVLLGSDRTPHHMSLATKSLLMAGLPPQSDSRSTGRRRRSHPARRDQSAGSDWWSWERQLQFARAEAQIRR